MRKQLIPLQIYLAEVLVLQLITEYWPILLFLWRFFLQGKIPRIVYGADHSWSPPFPISYHFQWLFKKGHSRFCCRQGWIGMYSTQGSSSVDASSAVISPLALFRLSPESLPEPLFRFALGLEIFLLMVGLGLPGLLLSSPLLSESESVSELLWLSFSPSLFILSP